MSKCIITRTLGLIIGSLTAGFLMIANKKLTDTARTVRFTPRQRLDYFKQIFRNLKGPRKRSLEDAMEAAAIATYSKAYQDAILTYDKMYDARNKD